MKKREVWLDVLRFLAAFLVIVNHTNDAYQMTAPVQGSWWLSIAWYVISKMGVPIYVMISGACLLGREDSYRKCLARFARIMGALVVFSYLHFLHSAWLEGTLRQNALRLDLFGAKLLDQSINDAYWYLYFYAGLMLMLPLLQRLSRAMTQRDLRYLTGMCLGFGMLWPMLAQLFPALAMPEYFRPALFSAMIGLFFLGWQLRQKPVPCARQCALCVPVLIACTALSLALLRLRYAQNVKYWLFMDDRQQPTPMVVCSAVCVMLLIRRLFQHTSSQRMNRLWCELGQCSFGIYLVHQCLINQTEFAIYQRLWSYMPAFFAGIVWELAVLGLSLAAAFVLRRTPAIRRLV